MFENVSFISLNFYLFRTYFFFSNILFYNNILKTYQTIMWNQSKLS